MTKNFSVIIATYTGVDTIEKTFQSLLNQEPPNAEYEIIVVIDGPNRALRTKVNEAKEKFSEKEIDFNVKQFDKNMGRFEARREAARIASYPSLLIVDDRVELPRTFLRFISSLGERVAMPDVEESAPNNSISLVLSRIREKIYAKPRDGSKSFYIDQNNFDRAAKGTTSLWIATDLFIGACDELARSSKGTKNISEDTRILRSIVESGSKIFKTSVVKIKYYSRSSLSSEFSHILHRGPRFIDYYLHPGRRFFLPLVAFYALLAPVIISIVLYPFIVIILLVSFMLISIWLSGKTGDWLKICLGLWLALLAFSVGLILGLLKKCGQALGR